MERGLLRQGGPHDVKLIRPDEYAMRIQIPKDSDGMIGRECPSETCSPAYFKVKLGTGIQEQVEAFCPYCARSGEPRDFTTESQVEYAKEVALKEATDGISRMVKDAFDLGPSGKRKIDAGLFSLELSYNPSSSPAVSIPFEEELRRDLVCLVCGLEHAVFGIAVWCPDCGSDIFLQHVSKEYDVVKLMLSDVDNRRERLGGRVGARDIENALEDTVSIFEAVLRAMTRRRLMSHLSFAGVEDALKRIGNKYQSIDLAKETALKELSISLFESLKDDEIESLRFTFEKRHPITHNLGIVDRKYLKKAQSGELEGRDVRVMANEVLQAIDLCLRVITDVYPKVFPIEPVKFFHRG